MFFPYGDNNPLSRTPWVNYTLILLNTLIFLLVCGGPQPEQTLLHHALLRGEVRPESLLSYMFLHLGFMHLAGNMLFLYIFGDNVEDKLGHLGYLVFYLFSGGVAAFFHVATSPSPCVGASGAIAGVMGAYVVLFPASKIKYWAFFWPFINRTVEFYTWLALGYWFVGQYLSQMSGEEAGVAFAAHCGGFISGAIIAGLLALANVVVPLTSDPAKAPRKKAPEFVPPAPQAVDLQALFEQEKLKGTPCPACIRAMQQTVLEGHTLDTCFECGGQWLSKEEAAFLLGRPQLPYSLLHPPARNPQSVHWNAGERSCPHCLMALRSVNMEGVQVEGCDRCAGIWLERGDLAGLRQRLGHKDESP